MAIYSMLLAVEARAQSSQVLFEAVRSNDLEKARSLLDKGADPNSYDSDSDHILMNAALYSSADMMRLLLEKGSNPNAVNREKETPLMWSTNDIDKIRLLLQHGADVNVRS
jgi:uncharacterized protein